MIPVPFFPALGTFAAAATGFTKFGGGLALSGGKFLAAPVVGGWSAPISRAAQYAANQRYPNQAPAPESIVQAYYTGQLNYAELYKGLYEGHGITLEPRPADANWSPFWQAILESGQPVPDISLATDMWRQGWLNDANYDKLLKRNGLFDPEIWSYMRQRSEQLCLADIMRLYRQGLMEEAPARFYMERIGWMDTKYQDLFLSSSIAPAPVEALTLLNRGTITEGQTRSILAADGMVDKTWQDYLLSLRYEIPGPSDLTRFAVRHVFEPSLALRFGFDAEMSQDYIDWHSKQGFGQPFNITDPLTGDVVPMTWAKANWWAHWVWPAPQQAYQMVQRMRPTGGQNGGPRSPTGLTFTQQDLGFLLRGNDYPPHWRPYLQAISYRVPQVRQLRWSYEQQLLDDAELIERYQDQGYTRADAELLAETDRKRLDQPTLNKLVKCIVGLYDVGGVDRNTARQNLIDVGKRALDAERELTIVDVCAMTSTLKVAVAAIRKSYLRGEIADNEAQARLNASGIVNSAQQYYLRRWNLEFTPRRKQLSTAQVMNALERGFISNLEAQARLANLGWDQPDRVILTADAARIIADRQAKAVLAAQRSERAASKEIERLAREADYQRRSLLSEINRIEPMSMLRRLAKNGDISRDDFISSLKTREIPDSTIALYVEDVYNDNPPIS